MQAKKQNNNSLALIVQVTSQSSSPIYQCGFEPDGRRRPSRPGDVMPVWKAAPVSVEPRIDLLQWRVMVIVPDGTFHFVGLNAATYRGRVSSEIEEFDTDTSEGRTRSGRVYQLLGSSGFAGVAEYVWAEWCAVNQVDSYIDMTEAYESEVPYDDA